MSIIAVNPYSFYDWWRTVTFATWNPSGTYFGSWVVSEENRRAALTSVGITGGVWNLVQSNVAPKGVSAGKIRAVEFKLNTIGPLSGSKMFTFGFNYTNTAPSASEIQIEFDSGSAFLDISATALQSGVRVIQAISVPSTNDVYGFTFDMSAINIVLRIYRNGILLAGPFNLSASWNNAPAAWGIWPAMSGHAHIAGSNGLDVTLRSRITEMEHFSSYTGANDGFWV